MCGARILHGSVGARREFPLSDNFFIVKKNNLRNFVYICSPERMINVAPDGAGRRGFPVSRRFWRDAGVVDRAALEMRCTGNCTGGSNPSLSAKNQPVGWLVLFFDSGKGAGVVELARLESEETPKGFQGFESPPFRKPVGEKSENEVRGLFYLTRNSE